MKTDETDLHCHHEEADTRMMYHLSKLESHSKIMIKAFDTDILVILLGNIHKFGTFEIFLTTISSKPSAIPCIN